MHDHVKKCTFLCENVHVCVGGGVQACVIMGHVHQHTEHEASVSGWRHLMPVTGLDQVCTNENWFLWKTESNQGQFSHLPRCTSEWRVEEENGKKRDTEKEREGKGEKSVDLLRWKALLSRAAKWNGGHEVQGCRRRSFCFASFVVLPSVHFSRDGDEGDQISTFLLHWQEISFLLLHRRRKSKSFLFSHYSIYNTKPECGILLNTLSLERNYTETCADIYPHLCQCFVEQPQLLSMIAPGCLLRCISTKCKFFTSCSLWVS